MIIRFLGLVVILSLFFACARQTSPNGGPKDLITPKLLNSTPGNNQKNFTGKILTFTFSEPVKLKDPKEEIIVTPQAGKDVIYLAKQNRITIETKAKWKDSTTYSIAFRDAVQDITESNPVENLKIAFSTGPVIDSLTLHGNVVDALTEKIPEKITVAIHQSDTFNVFKHPSTYFTKTDKNGKFSISNLKPGSYKVYAFDDKNKNLKVESKTESFGFYPGKETLPDTLDTLRIIMLTMDSRPIHLNNVRHADKSSTVKFNKELVTYSATAPGERMINSFGDDHSEIKFFHDFTIQDSIPVTLHATDSLEQKADTLVYLKTGSNPGIIGPFKYQLTETSINPETYILTSTITVNKPLRKTSFDSMFIAIDSTHHYNFTQTDFKYDTANNKINITKTLERRLVDTLKRPLKLFLGKGSFISMESDTSKQTTTIIPILKPEDTATLLIEVHTDQTNYEIQLLTETYKIVRTIRNLKKITFKNLIPGEYKIRAYLDKNNNNKWDPGNFFLDIPPEPTFFYKNDKGKYQFPLRANWEVGPYTITF